MRAPAMRGVYDLECVGHRGDFSALCCAARSLDVRFLDVDNPAFEAVVELPVAEIVLPACDPDIKRRPEFGKVGVIVGAKRFPEPETSNFLLHPSASDCLRDLEDLVRINHQPPVMADD